MARGAAIVASVGLSTTSRVRTRTILSDCIGVALSAFVGSVTGHHWTPARGAPTFHVGATVRVSSSRKAIRYIRGNS